MQTFIEYSKILVVSYELVARNKICWTNFILIWPGHKITIGLLYIHESFKSKFIDFLKIVSSYERVCIWFKIQY